MAKTGAKLKGRKRPKAVMEKAWETRRKNAAHRASPQGQMARAMFGDKADHRKVPGLKALLHGSKKPIRKEQQEASILLSEINREIELDQRQLAHDEDRAAMAAIDDNNNADYIVIAARAIMVEARKKFSEHAIARRLAGLIIQAKEESGKISDERHRLERQASARSVLEKVVAGFLAEVALAEEQHQGLPIDMVFMIPAFTVTKIVDALNMAGYSSRGRRPQPATDGETDF